MFRILSLATVLMASLLLSACGGMRLVESDVRSFANPPFIPTGASYRFERLPSQQTDAQQQARLETMAQTALGKVGLKRHEAAASYSVQVSVGTKVDPFSPWERPSMGSGAGWNFGFGVQTGNVMIASRSGLFGMTGFGMESPYYWRQVSLIVRSVGNNQVVYETHAANDGRWADSEAVLPAMFDAALQGFPNPPQGVRRINVEIPR